MSGDGSQGATGPQGPSGIATFPFSVVTKTFTGNGTTANFTIDSGYTVDSILVISNGVTLTPTVDYTLSGTTLTFVVTPLAGQQLVVRQMTGDGYQGATGPVSTAAGPSGATGPQGPQGPISSLTVLNDISNQFDGYKSVFNLAQDQTPITNSIIGDSKNLEVVVNGKKLSPYVRQLTYPWVTPYDSYNGFRVVGTETSSYVIIYNTPDPGDTATLTVINGSLATQIRKYPYSATTIALGD